MKLKALELHGYKSFANRTIFVFHDGVTAIVGPNGSGKSNVADAIQWVLGEQSFSSLRAKKTEDMIFAGSSLRLRMGMAEVSLTLDNSEQWLPIEFSEVTITRRAYRSGENEYLLNGSRVRLRDINEFLAKGGLGRGSYSVIGQGLIDQAISLRPEERRSLLEDAAGTSLYQAKKSDALSKLSATQENLTRVGDILHELEPRVRRLREQANRASQFNDVQLRLAERLQSWYGYQWQQAQQRLSEGEQAVERTQAQLMAAREGLQWSDAERAALRERIHALRTEYEGLQRRIREQQRAQQQLAQRRAVAAERLDLLVQRHAEAVRDLDALVNEHEALGQERQQLASELTSLQAEAGAAQARLRELQQALAQREERLHDARQSQAEAQRAALEHAARLAQHEQRLANARQRLQALEDDQARRRAAIDQRMVELQALDSQVSAARTQAETSTRELDHCTWQLDDVVQQATALQKRAGELSARQVEARAEVRTAQIEYERAQAHAVGHLLETARAAGVESAQALQALYHVAPEHERLVRGALGTAADALVVQHWTDAEQVAAQAATQQVILVVESFSSGLAAPSSDAPPDVPVGQEVSGRDGCSAFDLISCAPEHRPLFESLLAPVRVGEGRGTRVNERGDLITAHALITSDASLPNLAALEARLRECQRALQEVPSQVEQAQAEAATATHQRDALGTQRYALEAQRVQAQAVVAALVREREQSQREVRQLVSSLSRAQAEQASLAQQVAAWEEEHAALRANEPGYDAAGSAGPAANEDELALSRQLAHQETRAALLNQQYVSRQQMQAQIEQRIQAIAGQRQQRRRRAEQLLEETVALRSELASVDALLEQLGLRIEPLRAQAQPSSEQLSADEAALRTLEAQERGAREALYAAEAAHSESLVDFQRRQDRLSTLREQIEGDYEFVSLATDLPTALALEIDETRVLRLPHVLELPDGMEQDIRSLKNKMRWIGNVNLEAPSEYALEKARLEFLQVQSTDLQRASESLQQLVAELDQLMQNKFRETFQAVARAFKEYFTRLFGGGSAELILTEPENLIATGIDIIAHPPGKRRQPLGLLSGGERALTAAALIFALLKASPTPFCVLDEVDAALDEANIGRFRNTLHELAERTQFIVITHNRGTVEAAGTVYGISMGADGASQTLSLRLDGVEIGQTQAA